MNVLRTLFDQLRLTWRLIRDPRVPVLAKMIPLAGLVYIISPIDFVPDIIVGLGQLDDLGIFLLGLRLFESAAPEYVVEEHKAQLQSRQAHQQTVIDSKRYTIRDKK